MRRWGMILVVALAMGALPGTASAEAPEFGRCLKVAEHSKTNYDSANCTKLAEEDAISEVEQLKKGVYQWFPGVVKNRFTTKTSAMTVAVLEGVRGDKVVCEGETSSGEYVNAKELGHVVLKFNGCQTSAKSCNSPGAANEEIVTSPLGGPLGFETIVTPASKDHLAVELHPEAGNFAEYLCASLPVTIRGSVLHRIPANAMKLTATDKFIESKGKQKPEHFAGGVPGEHILEGDLNHGPFEQGALSVSAGLSNEFRRCRPGSEVPCPCLQSSQRSQSHRQQLRAVHLAAKRWVDAGGRNRTRCQRIWWH